MTDMPWLLQIACRNAVVRSDADIDVAIGANRNAAFYRHRIIAIDIRLPTAFDVRNSMAGDLVGIVSSNGLIEIVIDFEGAITPNMDRLIDANRDGLIGPHIRAVVTLDDFVQ